MATTTSQSPSLPPPSTASRRLPPPCWSHDETVALIDGYRDKWYSLRRGNLRANHWQEVADCVSDMSPLPAGTPPKTSVQCRHKMEKLRKRYRSEVQRSLTNPNRKRYSSSWVHFARMHSMEKGPTQDQEEHEEDDDDDDDDDFPHFSQPIFIKKANTNGVSNGGGNGVRIRFPGQSSVVASPAPQYPNFGNFGKVLSDGNVKEKKVEGGAMEELATAIKSLGDNFVRVERMKVEMVREVEGMRMEMEIKRTQMILDSQRMLVEDFVNGLSVNELKKAKMIARMES